jgi:hypothetical protein
MAFQSGGPVARPHFCSGSPDGLALQKSDKRRDLGADAERAK